MPPYHATMIRLVVYLLLSFPHPSCQQENVALGKPSQQSTTHYGAGSSLVVDGDRTPYYFSGSCNHTLDSMYPNSYWIVDLMCDYPIHSIMITNRISSSERLSDFDIYVSDVNPIPIQKERLTGVLCVHYTGSFPTHGSYLLECTSHDIRGRYVYVWKPGSAALTLCEFEVLVDKELLEHREMGFSVLSGRKSSRAPFKSTTMGHFSKLNCVRMCLAIPGKCTTAVQMEVELNTCECIEESGLGISEPDIYDTNWILIRSFGN